MSIHALEAALSALGYPCAVEAHERLAVLRAAGAENALADRALRERVAMLAAEHGFTHVAIELTDGTFARERAGATVSGN